VFTYLTLLFNLNPNDVGSVCPAEMSPLTGAALGYFMPTVLICELALMYIVVMGVHAYKQRQKAAKAEGLDSAAMAGAGARAPGTNPTNSRMSKTGGLFSTSKRRFTSGRALVNGRRASTVPSNAERKRRAKALVPRKALPIQQRFHVAFWRVVFFIYAGLSVTALTLVNCRDIAGECVWRCRAGVGVVGVGCCLTPFLSLSLSLSLSPSRSFCPISFFLSLLWAAGTWCWKASPMCDAGTTSTW